MVSILPLISSFTSLFFIPLGTILSAPTIIGETVTLFRASQFFFSSWAMSRYLYFSLLSINSSLLSAGTSKSTIRQALFFVNCYHYLLLFEFFSPALVDGFSWEFEWHQVSGTLLSILANLNNAVVWMVSTRPLISKFSSPCTNPLMTVQRAPITIGISNTFMVHIFSVPSKGQVLIFLFNFF